MNLQVKNTKLQQIRLLFHLWTHLSKRQGRVKSVFKLVWRVYVFSFQKTRIKHVILLWNLLWFYFSFNLPDRFSIAFRTEGCDTDSGRAQSKSAAMSSYSSSFFLGNSGAPPTPEFGKPIRNLFLLEEGTGGQNDPMLTISLCPTGEFAGTRLTFRMDTVTTSVCV